MFGLDLIGSDKESGSGLCKTSNEECKKIRGFGRSVAEDAGLLTRTAVSLG